MLRNCSVRSSFSRLREWRKCERSAKKRRRLDSNQLNRFSSDSRNVRRRALPAPWRKSIEIVMYGLSRWLLSICLAARRIIASYTCSACLFKDDIFQPLSALRSGIRSVWNFWLTLNAETCSLTNFTRCADNSWLVSPRTTKVACKKLMASTAFGKFHLKISHCHVSYCSYCFSLSFLFVLFYIKNISVFDIICILYVTGITKRYQKKNTRVCLEN